MKVTLTIPAEHREAFSLFLKQHPDVKVEEPDYTLPGPPMTLEEYRAYLVTAWQQARNGNAVELDEFIAEMDKW